MIWFAMLIPSVVAIVLLLVFHHKVQFWELLIPLVVSVILIALGKWISVASLTRDTEYWTGWIHSAEYYERWTEEWDEWVSEQRDSKGNVTVPGHYEHRIVHHPPSWCMYGSNGETFSIDPESYKSLTRLWGNDVEIDLWHMNQTSWGDGDKWVTKWRGERDKMVICTTAHNYENRVQASRSVFNFPEFTEAEVKERGLYDYPPIKEVTDVPSILGNGGPTTSSANRLLCVRNAELGKAKQVRMWVLIFRDTDVQTAIDQEGYWKGGNKNEFVLCIGVDGNNAVKWAYPFSWCENERLKVDVRQFVQEQKQLDLNKTVAFMADAINQNFVRKQFADFSYLTVEPTWGAVLTTFILTFIVNLLLSWWIVCNEFDETNDELGEEVGDKIEDWKDRFLTGSTRLQNRIKDRIRRLKVRS
jgi:hypothetical protein